MIDTLQLCVHGVPEKMGCDRCSLEYRLTLLESKFEKMKFENLSEIIRDTLHPFNIAIIHRLQILESGYEFKRNTRDDLNKSLSAIQDEYKEMIAKVNSEIYQLCQKINDLYSTQKHMSFEKPHKCPVCDGKKGFKNEELLAGEKLKFTQFQNELGVFDECKICERTGIVWG